MFLAFPPIFNLASFFYRKKIVLFFAFTFLAFFLPQKIYGAWPAYQGNSQANGVSSDAGPVNMEVKWTFTGDVGLYDYQVPLVDDEGTAYVIKTPIRSYFTNEIYAIKKDGSVKWKTEKDEDFGVTHMAYSDKGIVYLRDNATYERRKIRDRATYITALSAKDGSLLWRRQIDKNYSQYWIPAMTVDSKGRVFITAADSISLYTHEGERLWSFKVSGSAKLVSTEVTSPVLSNDEKTVYFIRRSGAFYALDADTGRVRWIERSRVYNTTYGTPVVGPDDTIYFANSATGKMTAFSPKGKVKWEEGFTSTEGETEYTYFMEESVPVIADGTIYLGVVSDFIRQAYFIALNAKTGKLKWKLKLEKGLFLNSAPIVDKDGFIYMPYGNGRVYRISSKGKIIESVLVGKEVTRTKNGDTESVTPNTQFYNSGMALTKDGLYVVTGEGLPKPGTSLSLIGSK